VPAAAAGGAADVQSVTGNDGASARHVAAVRRLATANQGVQVRCGGGDERGLVGRDVPGVKQCSAMKPCVAQSTPQYSTRYRRLVGSPPPPECVTGTERVFAIGLSAIEATAV